MNTKYDIEIMKTIIRFTPLLLFFLHLYSNATY